MSDQTTDPDQTEESEGIRNLREANDRLKEENTVGKAAQRELAFMRAGINTEGDPVAELVMSTYDGELTSEAIKAHAKQYKLLPDDTPTTTTDPNATENQLTHQQVRNALGEEQLEPGTPDPNDPNALSYAAKIKGLYEQLRDRVEMGDDPEAAADELLQEFMGRAYTGQPGFVWDEKAQAEWRARANALPHARIGA